MTITHRLLTPLYHHHHHQQQQQHGGNDKTLSLDKACPIRSFPTEKPRILAFSARIDRTQQLQQQRFWDLRDLDRKLCEDRKTPLEHLKPGNLAKSTFRIVVTQGSFILSNYANDQLQQDLARDKLVAAGEMTQEDADEAAVEWETREWKLRWESFPSKLTEAFVKYHVIVLVMRFYEHVASQFVDTFTLDSLTLDTFAHAKRLDAKIPDNRVQVGQKMFSACWSANAIAFLADYSVHQVILGYGYFRYIQQKRNKRVIRQQEDGHADPAATDKEPPIVKQSATLLLSRVLGLFFTAVGGAAGTIILPGWGTLLGSNLGDSLGGTVAELQKDLRS